MVPAKEQREIWRTYRPGQERDKNPSADYLAAFHRAVAAVAEREGKTSEAARYRAQAENIDRLIASRMQP